MALVDEVRIHAQAGRGGDGVVRWLHLKGVEKGGPAGGDGGKGGDIILEGVRDLAVLATYRFTKKVRAENGDSGDNNNKYGADGKPAIIKLPVGAVAKDVTSGETYEIMEEGQRVVIFKGGAGGFGNAHFKSSTNQNPEQYRVGRNGQGGDIEITLKLIADAGFIGFPNAGKSSLLNSLTHAKSKIGAYAFTTLEPYLGDFYGYILADIPGLISGASSGRGLGSKFLRHIERTSLLVHLVSAEQEDMAKAYTTIRAELAAFGRGLAEKPELVVISKSDMLTPEELAQKKKDLQAAVGEGAILTVSIIDDEALKAFTDELSALLKSEKAA